MKQEKNNSPHSSVVENDAGAPLNKGVDAGSNPAEDTSNLNDKRVGEAFYTDEGEFLGGYFFPEEDVKHHLKAFLDELKEKIHDYFLSTHLNETELGDLGRNEVIYKLSKKHFGGLADDCKGVSIE